MVCIIDDREDVWKFAPNLITVKKYIYFQGTGDINAPAGSKEAQQARKAGSQASEAAVTSGPTAGSSAPEERSNGRKKQRSKDHNNGERVESTAPSATQEAAANERTQPGEAVEEGRGQGGGADASTAAQVSDRTNVKEDVQGEEEDGSRTVGSEEEAPPTSSTPPDLHEPNSNLDFDLSSDSDSVTCKPPSSDSEGEYSQTRKSKQEGVEQAAVEEPSGGAGGKEEGGIKQKRTGENSSEVGGETSVLVLPPEQENGCSEPRVAESESQNSEQSGVTMEEEEVDQDNHLIYLQEVLERIHGEYYARYSAFLRKERPETPDIRKERPETPDIRKERPETPDIRKIVPELKARSLEGTTIVFSGLYPTNYPMERTRENYHAKALGAKIGKSLLLSSKDPGRTTHLIAARAGELLHTLPSESIHTP
ncbi:unnamed protein product [Oncorhynchus mykiss]|uniref:protein-serine/threonine phosphatase n=1 Tax=Oncorhynchus mykiss TaxID=8022 RepID=A0A060XDB3_ONCMY|nr:unnamed protein product [Oncorhynchus mykiss]